MKKLNKYLHNFLSLFFPQLCAACNRNLLAGETEICTLCLYSLPYTNFHEDKDNRMARQLWGRVPFSATASLFHFRKGSGVQNLVHQLKYNNKPMLGNKVGELLGTKLKGIDGFDAADLIIPVPLHPLREKKRGYNQSDHFANGLAEAMHIPVCMSNLTRRTSTGTQTRRSRFNRYENMKEVFEVKNPDSLKGKQVLLADDVFTTGATIEACCTELLKAEVAGVSIATIAFAD